MPRPHPHSHSYTRPAFTLIELLVVIAVIAILIGMLLPALGRARQLGFTTACGSNMHELGRGTVLYAQDYKEWTWNADRWLRSPNYNGKLPGLLYNYVTRADRIIECPKNKRRRTDGKPGSNIFGGSTPLDTDYTMVANTHGCRLSSQPFAAYLTSPLPFGSEPISLPPDTKSLTLFRGLPIYAEESTPILNQIFLDARWLNNDQITWRHDKGGNIVFLDTHVELFKAPGGRLEFTEEPGDFQAVDCYFRLGKAWSQNTGWLRPYGWINNPVP